MGNYKKHTVHNVTSPSGGGYPSPVLGRGILQSCPVPRERYHCPGIPPAHLGLGYPWPGLGPDTGVPSVLTDRRVWKHNLPSYSHKWANIQASRRANRHCVALDMEVRLKIKFSNTPKSRFSVRLQNSKNLLMFLQRFSLNKILGILM